MKTRKSGSYALSTVLKHYGRLALMMALALSLATACKKGDAGPAGIDGERGEKGDKGDKGDRGLKGDKGDKGDRGSKGDKGDTGENGSANVKTSGWKNYPNWVLSFGQGQTILREANDQAIYWRTFHDLEYTAADIERSAILVYMEYDGTTRMLPASLDLGQGGQKSIIEFRTATDFGAYHRVYFVVALQNGWSWPPAFATQVLPLIRWRVVIIPPTAAAAAQNQHLDFNDYQAVKKAFHIRD